ncbi:MAG: stress response translation initiation inhibitor YciH [Chloroflexi bacterium HGW-Chloroflexi-10]|nr:MAG: stress response translation initiation inhibitor YciH [Chloroflexi bacterium HGW-Chloroflexi-10]
MCPVCGKPKEQCICKKNLPTNQSSKDGIVRLRLERKGRGGKTVTLIEGLSLSAEMLKDLAKELKRAAGSGGAIKDGVIEVQGDVCNALKSVLENKGFRVKISGG